jgi:AcrR family transcriptional regulator
MTRQVDRNNGAVPAAALPATQARSERTRDRILDAAESLLKRAGPEAATVPAIAAAAHVAVGSVYRRFVDKDAVLRGVYERFLSRGSVMNRAALSVVHAQDLPLEQLVPLIVRAMVRGYQQEPALLSALLEYAERHLDSAFHRRIEALRRQTFAALEQLLLARRHEIRHPRPSQAINFLLATIGLVLKETLRHGKRSAIAMKPEDVCRELERLALHYLDVRRAD